MANEVDITAKVNDQASGPMDKIAGNSESMAERSGKAIVGLGNKIGGEFGELVSLGGEKLEEFGEHGLSANQKVGVLGAGMAGLGLALGAMGSAERAASQQLDASIEASGQSVDDFSKQIDNAKSKAEDFGHSGADADAALSRLDQTTGDMTLSLKEMNLVYDLAAAKHESLAAAAATVSAVLGGNTKVLKQYGIDMGTGTHSTEELQAALDQLAQKLSGQAAAASDTFTGRIKAAEEHTLAWASDIGSVLSPALTYGGGALSAWSAIVDIGSARSTRLAEAQKTVATATQSSAAIQATASAQQIASDATRAASAEATAGAVVASESAMADASEAATVAAGPLGWAIGGVGAALGLGAAAFGLFGSSAADVAKPISGLTDLLVQQNGVLNENTRDAVIKAETDKHLFDQIPQGIISQAQLTDGLNGNTQAYEANVSVLKAAIAAGTTHSAVVTSGRGASVAATVTMTDQAKAAKATLDAYEGLNTSIGDNVKESQDQVAAGLNSADALNTVAGSAAAAAGSIADYTAKLSDQQDALNQAIGNISDLSGGQLDASAAQDKFVTSTRDLSASLKKNGKDISDNSDSAIANRDAIRNSIQAAEAYMVAQEKTGVTVETATGIFNKNMLQLGATATQAGVTKTDWGQLVDQMNLTPQDVFGNALVQAAIFQESMRQTDQKVLDLISDLHRVVIPGAVYSGSVLGPKTAEEHGGIVGAAATGGVRSNRVLVGEHGPEIADLPPSTMVHSNPDSMRMLSGGGGGGNVTLTIDVTGADQDLVKMFRRMIRGQGGNVQTVLGT